MHTYLLHSTTLICNTLLIISKESFSMNISPPFCFFQRFPAKFLKKSFVSTKHNFRHTIEKCYFIMKYVVGHFPPSQGIRQPTLLGDVNKVSADGDAPLELSPHSLCFLPTSSNRIGGILSEACIKNTVVTSKGCKHSLYINILSLP
ncbi:hypothetical protein ATANTOWER_017514 [Ataeniobius toweri]|uniref:Uncharacterized protein n=1 Tax=Ataeniobius toweri TaxID=208326 RepID=A0ABU7BQT1_9TELE|nr:hypothetical protein [Ataeniobius toweri]